MTSSPAGTMNIGPINMGGGPNLIQRSLFASAAPTLPYSSWYTPGAGSPAVSTSDYYWMNGIYWSRPFDLDTMGTEGAAIKAREGMRYVWMMGCDHPTVGELFQATGDFYVGYSNDPQVFPSPTTIRMLRRQHDSINVVDQNGYTQNTFYVYQLPHLVYNPDPGAFAPFYIYAEAQSDSSSRLHELSLFTTSDFLTTALVGPAIPTTNFDGWTSFGKPTRLGINSWVVYSLGKADASAVNLVSYKYSSTDGWVWTPDFTKIVAGAGPYLTVGGVDYMLANEQGTVNDYVSLLAVDANKQSLGTYTRISTAFGPSVGNGSAYPWQTWLQASEAYEENGIASIYVTRGFVTSFHDGTNGGPYLGNYPQFYNVTGSITSNVLNVTSFPGGAPPLAVNFRVNYLSGTPYISSLGTGAGGLGTYNLTSTPDQPPGTVFTIFSNGGLWHDFIDQYYLITNATSAVDAAPLGVTADCVSGTVTISWNDCLPNRTYRVYRGTTVGTQATLIGDVTGVSITDTPTPGSQYFYKVVTLNSGVEKKNRIVNVYASNNTLMVTRHVNRVINDGGDTSKIDMTFLASVDSYLTSNDYYKYLMHWVDARFGIKTDGSGFVSKIYCLGTTRLPRGGDYTPTTSNTFPSTSSNTSYSTTSFRGTTPSWINNAGSAHGYFGNGRANNVQRKNEITMIAAYQKPGTAIATLFGHGENGGMYLQHASGSSGNVTFGMVCDVDGAPFTFTTATVPFVSATAAHVAAAVFDGTNLTAYLDGSAGTPVAGGATANNPTMTKNTVLRGQYASLSNTGPVLASGGKDTRQNYTARTYNISNEAQLTGACLAVFEKGLPSGAITAIGAMYA